MKLAVPGGDGKNKDQIIGKIRIGSLNKLFAYRYGGCPTNCGWKFPDDDAGLEDLKILLHHYRFTFAHKMPQIIKLRAPWANAEKVLEESLRLPPQMEVRTSWAAPQLHWRGVASLRIRIAPVDMSKEERRYYSGVLSEGKRLKKRRSKGMKTRAEYLKANSLSRDKPWEAEGISRRTWERRRKRDASLPAIHKNAHDRPASAGMEWIGKEVSKEWVSEHGSSSTQLPASPDLCQDPNFNPILSWLCLRAAYHQQMNNICDLAANAEAA